jgi:hypothetical protein
MTNQSSNLYITLHHIPILIHTQTLRARLLRLQLLHQLLHHRALLHPLPIRLRLRVNRQRLLLILDVSTPSLSPHARSAERKERGTHPEAAVGSGADDELPGEVHELRGRVVGVARGLELLWGELEREAGLLARGLRELGGEVAEGEEVDDGLDPDACVRNERVSARGWTSDGAPAYFSGSRKAGTTSPPRSATENAKMGTSGRNPTDQLKPLSSSYAGAKKDVQKFS